MNLFKKIIASVALFTLVASMVTTGVSAASADLTAANKLAADGIINDNSANPANYHLGDKVLRQEIAKVAANIAGLTPNATCSNKFSDVSATTPNTWACGYVEALLDAGLVSANAKFNPESNISKSEALKMMLEAAGYTNVYTNAANWQAETVAFAVQKGVTTSFSDYNTEATRGWIFSVASDARDSMNTGTDLLGSLLGNLGDTTTDTTTTTPTTTTTTTTTTTDTTTTTPAPTGAADVTVSLNPDSLANGSQIPNVGVVRFAKVDFTAGSQDATLNTVKISKKTLASVPAWTRIWFEKNGKRISGKAAFSSDNTAIVSFAPSYVVMAGETATLDLYVQLPTWTSAGNDFQFTGDVTDASVTVNGNFTTPLLTTATYTVAPAVFKVSGSNTTYNDLTNPLELAKFTLKNADTSSDTRDIEVQSLTLRQLGDASLSNISDIYVERNGKKVSTDSVVDGKYVTFTFNNEVIKDSTTATYYVRGLVSNVDLNNWDTYQFELKKDTDLNVVETLNGFRSSVYSNDAATTVANNVNLRSYLVNGSDVVFARDSSVELSKNVAKWTTNVTLMKGTIKSTSDITLEDPTINFTSTNTANLLFNTVYLKIGSTVMTWTPTATDTSASFLGLVTLPAWTNNVEIYADLKDTAPTDTFKFDDLRLSSFATKEYASNQNSITSSVWTVSWISVSIDQTTLTATRVDGLGNTTLAAGSKWVLLNDISLKVNTGNDVNISNPVYTVTYTGSGQNNVFLTLYADGVAVSTKTVNVTSGNTITFQNLNKVVTSTTPVSLSVKADLSDAFSSGTLSTKLTGLDITDVLTSNSVSLPTISSSAIFTVAPSEGQLAVSSDTVNAKLLLAGNTAEKLMSFSVKARNDDVRLRDLVFTGANLGALNNFKVIDVNNNPVAIATSNTSTGISFTNLNVTDVISKDTTKTYYLVADVNSRSTATGVVVTLDWNNSKVKGTNGNIVAMTWVASITSSTHRIEENMVVIAKEANPSIAIATSALRFSVAATGLDSVTLTGITLDTSIANYTGATDITVYKDTISNVVGTLTAASGALNGSNIVIPFTANNVINAGTTSHYYIAINGATNNATSSSWTVSLKDATAVVGTNRSVSVSTYSNMGALPITETK